MHPAHWSMPNSKREKTMLDPVQQAFEREMQAKEQAKPIRQGGTRRSAELDGMSGPGAQRLATMIRKHWRDAGFDVDVTLWPRGNDCDVRSNLVAGLPRQRK